MLLTSQGRVKEAKSLLMGYCLDSTKMGLLPILQYDRATATFVNHMSESNKMVRDARPQLEKAEMTAQDLVKRTNVLQERVRSRDQAYEELNHYNQKVADLKAEIAKKSKPNPKEDERLARVGSLGDGNDSSYIIRTLRSIVWLKNSLRR